MKNIGGELERTMLEKVATGDREALQEVHLVCYGKLMRFLTQFIPRHDLIEEIINDTLWAVWRAATEVRADMRPSTWIMRIAYGCALATLSRRGYRSLQGARLEDDLSPAPVELAGAEMSEWISLSMHRLPVYQRLTLELAYGQGHSCKEVAQIMNCPVATVRSRMSRACITLRENLPRLAAAAGISPLQPVPESGIEISFAD